MRPERKKTDIRYTLSLLSVCSLALSGLQASTPVPGDYSSIVVSGSNLIALDFDSDIYTSSDSGSSFTLSETTTDIFESLQAFGSTVIAVGEDGLILRSGDNGANWSSATTPTIFGSLNAAAARDASPSANVWLAVGFDGFDAPVFRSTNDGVNWSETSTLTSVDLEDVIWTGARWVVAGSDDLGLDGVVYHSNDGVSWTLSTLPASVSPLKALATDGSGVVLAAGENGELLRSTDDGLSFAALASGVSEDLNALAVDSSGVFYVGGVERVFLEIAGSSVTSLVPPTAGGATILDIVLIADAPSIVGAFDGIAVRTIPFEVLITAEGTEDFRLTIEEALDGKVYHVESQSDLTSGTWTDVPNKSAIGTGGQIFFDVSLSGTQLFWRVVEF